MKEFESTIQLFERSSFYYIICTALDGTYSYVNDNYARSFRYIADDLVGKPYHITMHHDDMCVCEETAAKCIGEPGRSFPATIRKHDGNGGYIITQWEYFAGFSETGELDGMFCMGYDVTELDRQKGQLKEIAFQQSHIVRRPLANILGIAHALKKMDTDASLENLVDMMIQSAEQLDEVIAAIVNNTHR